ncbi:ribosomal subunit 39S-domain-containing protein [Xylaria grammica]|nr:ribosomal subunit 39S-domain-containing protein [Xylaria grammica]
MRRIPRLRRPSGLTSSATNISRPVAGASNITQAFAPFSSSSSRPAITSRTTPSSSSKPSHISRFYSSQQNPTPAQEQTHEPGTALQTDVQATARIVDEFGEDLDLEEGLPVGPFMAPRPRAEAARREEVADPDYEPATTAAGLKKVGGVADWWQQPDNWAPEGDFVSFRPREKVVASSLIEAAVRRAVIEAFSLRQIGREDDLVGVWPTTVSNADLQHLLAWDVKCAEDGAVTLGGDATTVADGLTWKDDQDSGDDAAVPEALTADEAAALRETWDQSWKDISLSDPRIRFAVTKRVFQLTGQLVPDHQLSSITTVKTLLHALKKPPKPATFTEEVQKRHPELLELPNVTFTPRRVTRGDKEIALGRFQLMQDELKKRGLPAHGHGWASKGGDITRMSGKT